MKTSARNFLILALAAGLTTPLAGAQNTPPQGRPMHPRGGPGDGGPMQHPGPGGEHGMGHGMGHGEEHGMGGPGGAPFLRGLKLTEAQQDRVFAIMHAQAPQMREHHKAVAKAHEELQALARSGQFDEAKAAALSRTAAQAMAAAALLHARTEAQLLALLTPEQREQAAKHSMPQHQQGHAQPAPQQQRP